MQHPASRVHESMHKSNLQLAAPHHDNRNIVGVYELLHSFIGSRTVSINQLGSESLANIGGQEDTARRGWRLSHFQLMIYHERAQGRLSLS